MIHAMTFTDPATGGSWNTRDDWGLALMTQPVFSLPPVKTHLIDLPGGNGVIDLTTAITGYPVYGNREGSFEFVAKGAQAQWQARLSQIAGLLHGQRVRIMLDDDPGWYREGRLSLNIGACVPQYGTVVIDYSMEPYKWAERTTDEPWLWDPFSFVDGVIGNGHYIDPNPTVTIACPVTTDVVQLDYYADLMGWEKMLPTFTARDEDVKLSYTPHGQGPAFPVALATITAGTPAAVEGLTMENGQWIYDGDEIDIYAETESGTAALTVDFRAEYNGGGAWSNIQVTTTPKTLNFYPDSESGGADGQTHTGLWPRSAAGSAPVLVTFAATGNDVTLKATKPEDSSPYTTQTLTAGTPATVPGLVLYHGTWLYDGRAAVVSVYTASGTADLALKYREGRL